MPQRSELSTAPLTASAASNPVNARPAFGPLEASDIVRIQAVSQGVLSAQAREQVNPQEAAMLQSLHALAAQLSSLVTSAHPSALQLQSTANGGNTTTAGVGNRATQESQLRPHLNTLAQHYQTVQALPDGDDGKTARLKQISSQVQHITQQVEDALSIADDVERFKRLAELGQQTRSRTPAQWWADQRAQARASGLPDPLPDSPTITTEPHHRLGLDDLKNKAGH